MKHLCQGPKCHTYETQSRIRGTKGNKVLRTRFARYDIAESNSARHDWVADWEYYFCDERCLHNWLYPNMTQLINFVGLKTKPSESPIEITEETRQNWTGNNYTVTTIRLLSELSDNDTVTA